MTIPDYRQCKFETYGYRCGAMTVGQDICDKHGKCVSCGAQSTHGCDFCGQFVCGAPLCDDCIGTSDKGPSGSWGFLNHVHIRRGAPLPSEVREAEDDANQLLLAQSAALGVGGDA